ncbi:MAG: insulinase family protein [Nitrospinae bacterium]|nr:insulinase family protein [Nitrospinota bacterium]
MSLAVVEIKNYKDVLPNGLTLATIEMPHIHTLEIAMLIRAGLRFETEENNGISHFLEHMIFRGNRKYPDSVTLSKEFEKIGRDLRASTMSEYTFYGFSPHVSQVERGMELLADFFKDPIFPNIELEREVILEEYLEEINGEGKNVDINNHACKLLYKGSSLAMPIIGSEKSIRSITAEMIREYFEAYYNPGNMVLVGAGCIAHERFLELAERYFAPLPAHGTVVTRDHFQNSIVEDQKEPAVLFQYDSDSQAQLQICFRSVSYNDPDYYKMCLINSIFDGGVASRLQKALREDRGLVYSIECRATSLSDTGTFDFDVLVSPEKVYLVAQILFKEIASFLESGPREEELEHVKRRYSYDLEFDLDDPYKQIIRYGFSELYSQCVSVEEEREIVESITRQDLLDMARRVFVRENLNLVLVGPYTPELKQDLEALTSQFNSYSPSQIHDS